MCKLRCEGRGEKGRFNPPLKIKDIMRLLDKDRILAARSFFPSETTSFAETFHAPYPNFLAHSCAEGPPSPAIDIEDKKLRESRETRNEHQC